MAKKNPDLKVMKILLIDDIPENLDVSVQTLKLYDYDLFLAKSVEERLTFTNKILPHLILLDLMILGIKKFRKNERYPYCFFNSESK
jgi:response regulator RpfG family c-di-GMP phosphodiesterase|tara:strand:- start:43 stop:303 length:261 start_codon:yes stop_codon:yes gene_type:complete